MSSFIINIVLLSIPAVLLGVFRTRWWWSAALLIVAFIVGLIQGTLIVSDLWQLPSNTGLYTDLCCWLVWMVWSVLVGSLVQFENGSERTAFLSGALLGQLGGTLAIQKSCKSNVLVQRIGMVMCGSLIHPGTVMGVAQLWNGDWKWIVFWPFIVFGSRALRSDKTSFKDSLTGLNKWIGLLSGTLFLLYTYCAEWGFWGMVVCGVGLLIYSMLKRLRLEWSWLVIITLTGLVVNVAVAAGLPEVTAWGLEELPMEMHTLIFPILTGLVTIVTVIVGIIPVSIFALTLLPRLLDLPSIGLSLDMVQLSVVLGLLAGNVFPWFASETWKGNWLNHVLQTVILLVIGLIVLVI